MRKIGVVGVAMMAVFEFGDSELMITQWLIICWLNS